MTNWKQFKVKNKSINTSWIRFYLDSPVKYNNGTESYVDTKNRTPFDRLVVGDMIEIDTDRVIW